MKCNVQQMFFFFHSCTNISAARQHYHTTLSHYSQSLLSSTLATSKLFVLTKHVFRITVFILFFAFSFLSVNLIFASHIHFYIPYRLTIRFCLYAYPSRHLILPDALLKKLVNLLHCTIYTSYSYIVHEHIKNTFKLMLFSSINFSPCSKLVSTSYYGYLLSYLLAYSSPVTQKSAIFAYVHYEQAFMFSLDNSNFWSSAPGRYLLERVCSEILLSQDCRIVL